MANPFYVEPVNPLAALMAGQQGYDTAKKRADENLLASLGDQIATGNIDYNKAAATAAHAGNIPIALGLLKAGEEKKASQEFSGFFTGGGGAGRIDPIASLMAPQRPAPSVMPVQAPVSVPSSGPPVRQATEDIISAVPDSGPNAGQNIAPEVNAAGARTAQLQSQQPNRPIAPPSSPNPAANIPALMAAVSNPRLGAGQQAAAKVMLEHALRTSDVPPDQKDYGLYLRQGGTDDFTTWLRKNKTAGATMISTAEGMDAAQTKARITIDTHAIQDLSKKAAGGHSALPLLDRMISLSDKVPGGWAGPAAAAFARGASALGIQVPEGASNAELLASMSRQFIPSVRDPGSTSNYEQQLYSQAVPGLVQSQEGRVKIGRMFKAMIERNNEVVATYRKYVGSPELDQKLKELDARPMFSQADQKALEEASGTPSGTTGVTEPGGWTRLDNGVKIREIRQR